MPGTRVGDLSESKADRFDSSMPRFPSHSRQTMSHRANPVLLGTDMPNILRTVFGCFCAAVTKLSSCDRDLVSYKP